MLLLFWSGSGASSGTLLDFSIPSAWPSSVFTALVVRDSDVNAAANASTWTLDDLSGSGSASDFFLDIWTRTADRTSGARGGDIVSFFAETPQEIMGSLFNARSALQSTIIERVETRTFASTTAPLAPDSTSSDERNLVLAVWACSGSVTLTPPSGWAQEESINSAVVASRTLMVASREAFDAGTVSPGACTASTAVSGRSWTIVLKYTETAVTEERIRDRIIALITALNPTIVSGVRFRHSQDEGAADFQEFAAGNAAGAFRRFQVRTRGLADGIEASSVDMSVVTTRMTITVAYPHDKKAGPEGGRDRDDALDSDWRKINYAIGIYGRANFSGNNDCTPMNATKSIERGENCDFLVIDALYRFYLDTTA